MLKTPIAAKNFRIRVHWANSAEDLAEEVNSNLDVHPRHAIYGMEYQMAMMPGDDNKHREKHFMAVFFRP